MPRYQYSRTTHRVYRPPRCYKLAAYTCVLGVGMFGLLGNFLQLQLLTTDSSHFLNHFSISSPLSGRPRYSQSTDTQDVAFQRILQQSLHSQQVCSSTSSSTSTLRSHVKGKERLLKQGQGDDNNSSLPPFGVSNVMTSYLSESTIRSNSEKECVLAPTTACHLVTYSMLVTFEGTNSNLRTLFLNLLSFLTFVNCKEIVVVIVASDDEQALLQDDAKYGQRILRWNQDKTHIVRVVYTDSIWHALQLDLFTQEAVIWMDGTVLWEGNGRGVEAGFELWKRHSQSLVTARGFRVRQEGASPDWLSLQKEALESAWLQEEQSTPRRLSASNTTFNNVLLPTCPNSWTLSLDGHEFDNFQLVDTYGLFVHRNLFCFLQHGVFDELKRYAMDNGVEKLAMTVIMHQISGDELPRSYPRTVRTSSDYDTTDNGKKRRRRTTAEDRTVLLKSVVATNSTQFSQIQSRKNETATAPPRIARRAIKALSIGTTDNKQHSKKEKRKTTRKLAEMATDETLTTIFNYFGSMPPGAIGWCLGSNFQRVGSRQHCFSNDVHLSKLPWMNGGGFGNALCAQKRWSHKLF